MRIRQHARGAPEGKRVVYQQVERCIRLLSQYLYFCTSNASKVSEVSGSLISKSSAANVSEVSICTFVLVKQVKLVQQREEHEG